MTWETVELDTGEEGIAVFGFQGPDGCLGAPIMTSSTQTGRRVLGIVDIDGNLMLNLSHSDEDDEECLRGIMAKACDLLNFSEQQIDHEMEQADAAAMLQSTISSLLLGQLNGI